MIGSSPPTLVPLSQVSNEDHPNEKVGSKLRRIHRKSCLHHCEEGGKEEGGVRHLRKGMGEAPNNVGSHVRAVELWLLAQQKKETESVREYTIRRVTVPGL